jgi:hypothetical protein
MAGRGGAIVQEDQNVASGLRGAPGAPEPAANPNSLAPPPRTRLRNTVFRVAALLLGVLSVWVLWASPTWTLGTIVSIPFMGLMLVYGLFGVAPDLLREDAARSTRADWQAMRGEWRRRRRGRTRG